MRFLRLAVPDVEEVAGSVTSLGRGLQLSGTGTPVEGATWKSQPSQSPLGRPGDSEWVSLLSPLKRQGLGTEPGNRHNCFKNTARGNSMVLAQKADTSTIKQNGEHGNTAKPLQWLSVRASRIRGGDRTASINGVRKTGYLCAEEWN